MRERFCRQCNGWHQVDSWPLRCYVISAPKRSDLAVPMLLKDGFDEPVQSMADGKFYTSKAMLRETYKPSGNPQGVEYIEMGNEKVTPQSPRKTSKDELNVVLQQAEAAIARGEVPQVATE